MSKKVLVFIRPAGVIALARFVLTADLRARIVDPAAVVRAEVLAPRLKLDIPIPFLDEHTDTLVHEIPSDVIIVSCRGRLVQGQGDIPAARGQAVFTKKRAHTLSS